MNPAGNTIISLQSAQLQKLREHIAYLETHSPFYKTYFQKKGIASSALSSIEDITRFPFTTKEDLQQHNLDFRSVPMDQVSDIVMTSGTSGQPVSFYLSPEDLDRLALNEQQALSVAGITSADIVQLTATSDKLFMAGLAYILGLKKTGAATLRVGPGAPELQWKLMQDMKSTVLIAVPSFILKLLEYAEQHQIDPSAVSVRKIICIGEAVRNSDFSLNALGKRISRSWPVELYSTYASTEMSTAFTECIHGTGGHHLAELLFIEVLDEHDQPVAPGEAGELVVTPLAVKGMPLLRFKTGDICHYYTEPCACGRPGMRLGPLLGRKNQMIKFKGTTLYPTALADLLHELEFVTHYYSEVSTDAFGLDTICIHAACQGDPNVAEKRIKEHFKSCLRVTPEVQMETAEQIQAVQTSLIGRKFIHFLDRRS